MYILETVLVKNVSNFAGSSDLDGLGHPITLKIIAHKPRGGRELVFELSTKLVQKLLLKSNGLRGNLDIVHMNGQHLEITPSKRALDIDGLSSIERNKTPAALPEFAGQASSKRSLNCVWQACWMKAACLARPRQRKPPEWCRKGAHIPT